MRAITLYQPWASLIAEKVKNIETRGKRSPWSSAIGETIAIHAAVKSPPMVTLGEWHCDPRYRTEPSVPAEPRIWRSLTQPGDLFGTHESRVLPLGAVVATCRLVDVIPIIGYCGTDMGQPSHVCRNGDYALLHRPDWDPLDGATEFDRSDQLPFGDFTAGRFALLLDNVQKVEPFPCRGFQGLWTLPESVADNLVGRCA